VSQERHFGELYKVRTELKSLDICRHLERERERERETERERGGERDRERVMMKSMIIF
jgi:hypothetical protein